MSEFIPELDYLAEFCRFRIPGHHRSLPDAAERSCPTAHGTANRKTLDLLTGRV